MSIHWLNEDASYEQIRNAARQRLTTDRAAGGSRKARADQHGPALARHVTASGHKRDPCSACGQEWPCDTIRIIPAPG